MDEQEETIEQRGLRLFALSQTLPPDASAGAWCARAAAAITWMAVHGIALSNPEAVQQALETLLLKMPDDVALSGRSIMMYARDVQTLFDEAERIKDANHEE